MKVTSQGVPKLEAQANAANAPTAQTATAPQAAGTTSAPQAAGPGPQQ
jgi:hypothetical protein